MSSGSFQYVAPRTPSGPTVSGGGYARKIRPYLHDTGWAVGMMERVHDEMNSYKNGGRREGPHLFDRSLARLTLEEWTELFQWRAYRDVARYEDEDHVLSVCWSGFDPEYNSMSTIQPTIYEVAYHKRRVWDRKDTNETYRYATFEGAMKMYNHLLVGACEVPDKTKIDEVVKSLKGMI